jgi:hypothetical protein
MGHQERFSPPKLNAGCGLTKETFAGLSRNEEDAPKADLAVARQAHRLWG